MRGTVRRHGKGWQFIYWVDGRQRSAAGFPTKREAQAELAKRLATLAGGLDIAPSKITVGEFLVDVWLPSIRSTIKETTLASYTTQVRTHLVKHLGRVKLQKLTPAHLQTMYADLAESGKVVRQSGAAVDGEPEPQGLSPNSIRRVHSALHRALNDAIKWGYVTRNVASVAKPPRSEKLSMAMRKSPPAATKSPHI